MLVLGIGGCAAALGLALAEPAAMMAGWLAAFVFCSSLPLGALALAMLMQLAPGAWTAQLARPAEAGMWLLPPALLAALPVLLAPDALYPWATGGAGWLAPVPFLLRSILLFAAGMAIAQLLRTQRRWAQAVSAVGMIGFVLIDTVVAVDWLMSLDPKFHSSGFGLYVLSLQMVIALCCLIGMHLLTTAPKGDAGVSGSLLLTTLLFWAYLAFMQYVIIWSGNLPSGAAWYARRGVGAWATIETTIVALHLAPAFLLLFRPIRHDPRWILALIVAVLVGKALETAWLVLPELATGLLVAAAACMLAMVGLGTLAVLGLQVAWRHSGVACREVPA